MALFRSGAASSRRSCSIWRGVRGSTMRALSGIFRIDSCSRREAKLEDFQNQRLTNQDRKSQRLSFMVQDRKSPGWKGGLPALTLDATLAGRGETTLPNRELSCLELFLTNVDLSTHLRC